jgi:hypothetical protein
LFFFPSPVVAPHSPYGTKNKGFFPQISLPVLCCETVSSGNTLTVAARRSKSERILKQGVSAGPLNLSAPVTAPDVAATTPDAIVQKL